MDRGAECVVPVSVVLRCEQLMQEDTPANQYWLNRSERWLWDQLCLSILSSRVRFEVALTATRELSRRHLLTKARVSPSLETKMALAVALAKPLPSLGRNSVRFYRFPRAERGASLITAAASVVYHGRDGVGLKRRLERAIDPSSLREELVCTIPGIGMKQASHFLSAIGFTDVFAIIDAHVRRFAEGWLETGLSRSDGVSPARYVEIEERLRNLACALGVTLHVLDRAIWESGRRRDS